MAKGNRHAVAPPTRQRTWHITEPAIEHLAKMQGYTGMQPGQIVSFAIVALSMGLTRSEYVSALLKDGIITPKEAKEGWGL